MITRMIPAISIGPPIQVQKPGNPESNIAYPIRDPMIGSIVTLVDTTNGGVYRRQVFRPVCPRIPAIKASAKNHGK